MYVNSDLLYRLAKEFQAEHLRWAERERLAAEARRSHIPGAACVWCRRSGSRPADNPYKAKRPEPVALQSGAGRRVAQRPKPFAREGAANADRHRSTAYIVGGSRWETEAAE